jgi:hypothetical protein
VSVDRVTDPRDDTELASDGIHDERLQEYAESVASDVDPKDSRTRQEHADNLSTPDAPPPRSPDSSDQRGSADRADQGDQKESPSPAEGDSLEIEDPRPHDDAHADSPEDSERQEDPSDEVGNKPGGAAEYGNHSTENPPDDQCDHQPTSKSDETPDLVRQPHFAS